MSFLIPCPNCGPRSAYEFGYGGEVRRRPQPAAPLEQWAGYVYLRQNPAGEVVEWWFHHQGCRRWFQARRDTVSNQVVRTFWPDEEGW